jgi:hypothetical protein
VISGSLGALEQGILSVFIGSANGFFRVFQINMYKNGVTPQN